MDFSDLSLESKFPSQLVSKHRPDAFMDSKFKRILSALEVGDKMEMGLCIVCDKPFTEEHQSAHRNIRFVVVEKEDEESDHEEADLGDELREEKEPEPEKEGQQLNRVPTSGGTSSMRTHLSRCKDNPHKESNKRRRQGTSHATEGVASSPSYSKFDQEACRVQLAKTFVSAELPFRFVENEEFRRLLALLQPRFDIPSRSTLRRDIWGLFTEEKVRLKKILSKHCGRVCLTTDTWTSVQNLTYMSLTAHYIDCEWKLQKKIVNFCQITGHSGEAIARYIEDFLNNWELNRVLTITVDNASANEVGLRYLKSRMESWDNLVLNGDYVHMRCCAHILNLVVKEGLKEVDDSILKIRCAVKYVKGSPARLRRFMECAGHERISYKGALILDVETRWNSTCSMIQSALEYQNAFGLLQLRDKAFKTEMVSKGKGLLKKEDWDHANSVLPFLKMFMLSTEHMSRSSYVTSNLYMREVFGIGTKIQKHLDSNNESLKKMAEGMKTKYDKYWGDPNSINILLLIAVVLDPRMKLAFVEYYIEFIYVDASKANELKLKVMSSLRSLYNQYQGIEEPRNSQLETQLDDNDDDDPMFLYLQKTGRRVDPQSELDKYLKEEAEPYNKNVQFDILGWWKVNATRFLILSSIAREVLAIPVSTVASECAFSTGGRILNDHRSCLTQTIVEALICLQDWLKGQPLTLFYDEDPEEINQFEQEICSQECVDLDD